MAEHLCAVPGCALRGRDCGGEKGEGRGEEQGALKGHEWTWVLKVELDV